MHQKPGYVNSHLPIVTALSCQLKCQPVCVLVPYQAAVHQTLVCVEQPQPLQHIRIARPVFVKGMVTSDRDQRSTARMHMVAPACMLMSDVSCKQPPLLHVYQTQWQHSAQHHLGRIAWPQLRPCNHHRYYYNAMIATQEQGVGKPTYHAGIKLSPVNQQLTTLCRQVLGVCLPRHCHVQKMVHRRLHPQVMPEVWPGHEAMCSKSRLLEQDGRVLGGQVVAVKQ